MERRKEIRQRRRLDLSGHSSLHDCVLSTLSESQRSYKLWVLGVHGYGVGWVGGGAATCIFCDSSLPKVSYGFFKFGWAFVLFAFSDRLCRTISRVGRLSKYTHI